jgi:hypothetical protein
MNKTEPKHKPHYQSDDVSIKQLLEGMHYAVDNIRMALIVRDREFRLRNLYDALMHLRDLG